MKVLVGLIQLVIDNLAFLKPGAEVLITLKKSN
jgi:hypothetical protein